MVRGKDPEVERQLELTLGTGSPVNPGEITVDRDRVLVEDLGPSDGGDEMEGMRRENREMQANFARSQEESKARAEEAISREQRVAIKNATLLAALERKEQ